MGPPRPDQLCEICLNLMKDLISKDIPWELEPAIPHQPNILLLEQSSLTCSLCFQVWVAAGQALGNRGGMVTFSPRRNIEEISVTIQAAASNYGMGGMFKAMSNGAMVSHSPEDIQPDLSELQWVHPRSLTKEPEKVGSYLFGNWYMSPYTGQDTRLMLVGLGVRLGTSPQIGDALGNKPDEWFLSGSYLRFRTQHDSSLAYCIPGRIRNWDLSSERALSQVRYWLDICDKHHQCLGAISGPGQDPVLPTRVIRVSRNSDKVCMMVSGEESGRYIALSHSWGKSHRLTLTKANLLTLNVGFAIADMPQTFRDAVKVCQALEISYLWIDSLCIVQDDPEDWEREASKMSSVYMNSYLTISALHSTDDTDGCFPSIARSGKHMPFPYVSPDVVCTGRPTIANAVPFVIPKENTGAELDSYNHAVVFSMHGTGDRKYYITNEWMPPSIESSQKRYGAFNFGTNFDPLKPEPLSSRGWVLQERLLSPRTLHYSEGQMYWECQTIVLGEDGSMLQRRFQQVKTIVESHQKAVDIAAKTHGTDSQYVADEWLKLVEVFSTRKLTVQHDKLVAISGIAKIVADGLDDEYCAGLWKSNLLNGLCWKKKVFVPRHQCSDEGHEHSMPEATASQLVVPADYRAPSWSWAALDGEITFHNTWLATSEAEIAAVVAKEVHVDVKPVGQYKLGRVESGCVSFKTIIGSLRADAPAEKMPGQVVDEFHVVASLSPVVGSLYNDQRYNEESESKNTTSFSKMFSSLTVSPSAPSSSASASISVPCKILFDTAPQFPCTAAFITDTFALVLKHEKKNTYTRIGVAEFVEKETEAFIKAAQMNEISIL